MTIVRRSLQILAFTCTLLIGVAAMALIVTQTTWFKEWMRGLILRQAAQYLNGELSIGRLDGNLLLGVELEDIDVKVNGQTVVGIKDVGLDYNAFTFVLGHVVLDDIRLNEPVFRLENTGEGWNLARLIRVQTPDQPRRRRALEIGEIGISNATVYVEDRPAGPVGTSGVVAPSRIERLDASIGVRSDADALTLDINHVSFRAEGPNIGINALSGVITETDTGVTFDHVSLRTEESSLSIDGTISTPENGPRTLDLNVSSDKFAVNELARVIPALRGYTMQPAFEARAHGPLDRLSIDFNVREAVLGNVTGDLTVDAAGPDRRIAGTASAVHFNIAPLLPAQSRARFASDITGRARFDLALPHDRMPLRGTYTLNAGRVLVAGYDARDVVARGRINGSTIIVDGTANAYGGRASAAGTVVIAQPVVLDLKGRAANVDLRSLPQMLGIPRVGSNLQLAYHLTSRDGVYVAEAEFDKSTLAGAVIAPRTIGRMTIGGGAPSYGARGEVVDLDIQQIGRAFDLPTLAADRFRSRVNATFDITGSGGGRYPLTLDARGTASNSELFGATIPLLDFTAQLAGDDAPSYGARGEVADLDIQQIGRAFDLPALAADRFRGRVNATFDITGSGGGRYPLTLDGRGTASNSELFGATIPLLDFTAQFADGDARIGARGEFTDLNPAVVTGDPRATGGVTGMLDVNTTLRDYASGVTTDSVDASGRVTLTRSQIRDLTIDSASVEGTYANGEGELARFDITGPDLTANGHGRIALTDTGSSNLAAHIETPSLTRIGEIIGRPLAGSAVVDATITGNARELRAQGNLQGSNVGYGETRALTLASTFDVVMPDLMPEQSTVKTKNMATFVEINGQSVRQLTGDIAYSQSRLDFNAAAQEGPRELTAQGSAILHPDHHEVHIEDLALRTQQIEWRKVPGTSAAVRFGDDQIAVENLQLVSGQQRIDADGVLGSTSDVLRVRAANVDVAQLEQLLLTDQRIAGRLDADATLSGPLTAPRAEGQFTLTNGMFQQFKFESLGGKLDYVRQGLNVDLRLQQSPQAWLAATGYAPLSLFRRNPPGMEGHETPTEGEAIDLQISSSQIDLGVVQGFTSYVTNVTGVLEANVKVMGTGHDPHFDGVINIRGGAFAIPDLGTAYTGLDTRVELKPDEVTISEIRIVDDHKKVMTIGGTLAVHERAVGAVDVNIQAQDFEVIHNQLANLKVDTQLRVTGEVRAPRIEGFVELENGNIDVARVMEEATSDAYAEAGPLEPTAEPTGAAPSPPQRGLLDAVDLDIGVAVPSSLILRGTDLRPANAAIDMGDLNVTVGGALQVRKPPGEPPRIIGEVNTVRGSYAFQGRRFEILRDGRIRFGGGDQLDPLLDLRARRLISGVEVFVRLQGSMRQPELTFSSNPPQDQADILSLIVFNVPTNQLAEGQQVSLAERAAALAGGYLASGLTRSIANALQLEEFEIQAEEERGLSPSLTIGEQVGDRLFFRIRQGFGAAEATEFILEYQIADFLRMQGSVAETPSAQRVTFRRVERGGLDLIFFFSY